MKKAKYDISKIQRKPIVRKKISSTEALSIAIRNSKAMAANLKMWIDANKDDDTYLLTLEADEVTTHLFCKTEHNPPFPMIMYKINTDLNGVIRSTMAEIKEIRDSLTQNTIQEGLALKIHSTMLLQEDRMETFLNAAKTYSDVLHAELGAK